MVAQTDMALPYGLRNTTITPYTTAGADILATPSVKVPNAQKMSFSEAEDFEELRGDDKVIAIRGKGASVEWEMENGGISLKAYAAMAGGLIVTAGISPIAVTTYTKKVTDARPYFRAEGQAINDNGGDFHTILYRCKASKKLEGELADGKFWVSGASGESLPSLITAKLDVLYEFLYNETAASPI